MAVSRRRSVESVDYLGNSYDEADNKPSDLLNSTLESLDTLDLNSSVGSSNLESKDARARVIDYEREEGDGQEYESDEGQTITSGSSVDGDDRDSIAPKSEKKLDDDEDRRNPQYIPKRGTFYEHDDRTAEDDGSVNDMEKEAERVKEQLEKKKVWKEHENRWAHDKFNEDEQKPKSAEELIELYGYDIRSEEGPPRARRRRRYGRGPNKYTRNWEDEDAYNKPSPVSGQGRGGGGGGRRGGGMRGEVDRFEVEDRRRSEDDLHSNGQRRPDERNSVSYYSNKVSGRRDDRRDNREAFPALPGTDSHRNDSRRPRSPREERPNNNAPTNPAWKKESPNPQNRLIRDDYAKSKNINTGPLQLTPPPVRRELDVNRRRADDSPPVKPVREPLRAENHLPEFEPIKKGAGRGIMAPGRRGKNVETTSPPASSRGPGGVVQRGIYRGRVNPGRSNTDNRDSRSEPPADKQASSYQQQIQGPKLRTQEDLVRDLARMTVYSQSQSSQGQELMQPQLASREFTRRPQPEANKGGGNYQRQTVVPPRLQQQEAAANRPKRYSSLRQRSLPESGVPGIPQPQPPAYSQPPHQYYQGDNNVDPVPHYVNGHRTDANTISTYQDYIVSRQGYVQQPVYAEAPQQQLPPQPPLQMIHPPTTYAAAFPSPPTFIQPVLRRPPSPHYLPPPPPPQAVINFVQQPQAQFNPQPYPPFQGFATVNPPPPPPTELYQPQGGITYYRPEEQIIPRAITRRERSAIPIVPPPERQARGRGRMVESEMYDTRVGVQDYADSLDNPEAEYGSHEEQTGSDYDATGEQYQDYEVPGDSSRSELEALGGNSQSDYEASSHNAQPEYRAADRSRSDYEGPSDLATLDYDASDDHEGSLDLSQSDYEASDDHSRSDSRVTEEHFVSDSRVAEDHFVSDDRVAEDHIVSDNRVAEDHIVSDNRIAEDQFISDNRVAETRSVSNEKILEDISRTNSKAFGDHEQPEVRVSDNATSGVTPANLSPLGGNQTEETSQCLVEEKTHDGSGDRARSSASDEKYEDAAEVVAQEVKVTAS